MTSEPLPDFPGRAVPDRDRSQRDLQMGFIAPGCCTLGLAAGAIELGEVEGKAHPEP